MDSSTENTKHGSESLESDASAAFVQINPSDSINNKTEYVFSEQNLYVCPKQPQDTIFFDAVVYYSDKDYNEVKLFMKKISKILNDKGLLDVRIIYYNNTEFPPSLVSTDNVMHQCSLFFFYLTNNLNFTFILEELVSRTRLGNTKEKQFSVRPIHTQPKDSRTYSECTGLRSVRGIDWYDSDSDFTQDVIHSIFKEAVRVRKNNEGACFTNKRRDEINRYKYNIESMEKNTVETTSHLSHSVESSANRRFCEWSNHSNCPSGVATELHGDERVQTTVASETPNQPYRVEKLPDELPDMLRTLDAVHVNETDNAPSMYLESGYGTCASDGNSQTTTNNISNSNNGRRFEHNNVISVIHEEDKRSLRESIREGNLIQRKPALEKMSKMGAASQNMSSCRIQHESNTIYGENGSIKNIAHPIKQSVENFNCSTTISLNGHPDTDGHPQAGKIHDQDKGEDETSLKKPYIKKQFTTGRISSDQHQLNRDEQVMTEKTLEFTSHGWSKTARCMAQPYFDGADSNNVENGAQQQNAFDSDVDSASTVVEHRYYHSSEKQRSVDSASVGNITIVNCKVVQIGDGNTTYESDAKSEDRPNSTKPKKRKQPVMGMRISRSGRKKGGGESNLSAHTSHGNSNDLYISTNVCKSDIENDDLENTKTAQKEDFLLPTLSKTLNDSMEIGSKSIDKMIPGENQACDDTVLKISCSGQQRDNEAEVSEEEHSSFMSEVGSLNPIRFRSPFMQMAMHLNFVNKDQDLISPLSVVALGEASNI